MALSCHAGEAYLALYQVTVCGVVVLVLLVFGSQGLVSSASEGAVTNPRPRSV